MDNIEYREDGSVQFVISHVDPEHANWLDTAGHNFGHLNLRWLDSKDYTDMPKIKVVKVAQLQGHEIRLN